MKNQIIALLISSLLVFSCGTTEKVITDNGKVYEVKGDTFYNNGNDVTQILSSEEKQEIMETLSQRLDMEKEAEERKNQLKKEQKELEDARKKVEKAQDEIEREIKEKNDARDEFFKAKDELKDERERYNELLKKGDLSPNDKADWLEKLRKLEKEVQDAEDKLKRY